MDEQEPELIRPEDFLPVRPVPLDASRMGLDRYSGDGALILLAASLDGRKRSHRLMAWLLLVTITLPLLLSLWALFG
jgi:hypothetical protein